MVPKALFKCLAAYSATWRGLDDRFFDQVADISAAFTSNRSEQPSVIILLTLINSPSALAYRSKVITSLLLNEHFKYQIAVCGITIM